MSGNVDTRFVKYNSTTKDIHIKFDGFISPDILGTVGVQIDADPYVIDNSKETNSRQQATVLSNFAFKYPKIPITVKNVTFSDVVMCRPIPREDGTFGGQYKYKPQIGIPMEVGSALLAAGRKAGYKISDNIEVSSGYYWIRTTLPAADDKVVCALLPGEDGSGFMRAAVSDMTGVLSRFTNDEGELTNTIGYAEIEMRLDRLELVWSKGWQDVARIGRAAPKVRWLRMRNYAYAHANVPVIGEDKIPLWIDAIKNFHNLVALHAVNLLFDQYRDLRPNVVAALVSAAPTLRRMDIADPGLRSYDVVPPETEFIEIVHGVDGPVRCIVKPASSWVDSPRVFPDT